MALLYDITHDNQHYSKVSNVRDQLPRLAQLAFGNVFNGSTKGFDDLYPINPSVVDEGRSYALASDKDFELKEDLKMKTATKLSMHLTNLAKNNEKLFLYGSWNNWRTPVIMTQNEFFENIYECERVGST